MRDVVGIVPAAGHAVRLQPLPCSKEAWPVAGRPLMSYVLVRLDVAGCTRVRVVTRPEKDDVVALAAAHGAEVVLGRPRDLAASLARGLDGVAGDAIVLAGFPDSIWSPRDGLVRLRRRVEDGADAALGLFRVDDPQRSDAVTVDARGRVAGNEIKAERPASDWIWGCLAARAGALDGLDDHAWPGEHLAQLARTGRVDGVRLSERYLDVGTREALASAEAWIAGDELVA